VKVVEVIAAVVMVIVVVMTAHVAVAMIVEVIVVMTVKVIAAEMIVNLIVRVERKKLDIKVKVLNLTLKTNRMWVASGNPHFLLLNS